MKDKNNSKPEFVFSKKNYLLMLLGLLCIGVGFVLMSGGGSDDPKVFNPKIFNFRRLRLAPTIILIGFIIEVWAIMSDGKRKS